MMKKLFFTALASIALAACEPGGTSANVDNDYRVGEARALAKSTLNKLQGPSIRENREYCGYIGENPSGAMAATPAIKGDASSCGAVLPSAEGWTIVASYHTHAGYDPAFNSEVPSTSDVEVDQLDGTDGYVSTPGGRFWYINADTGVVTVICGVGCLTKDPRFTEAPGSVRASYRLSDLRNLESGF